MKDKKKVKNPEVEQLKNQLTRTLADYDNLRKRTEEEKLTWIKFASQKLIQNLLPILDGFESAEAHLKDQGLAIGINQLKELLKSEGLIEIKPKVGDKFDANLEEAVEVISDKEKDETVAEVLVSGWKFTDGIVVRHARVKVFKKAS